MSPELYDAYRTAGIHVTGVWDWYLLQIDEWGLPVVLVWQLGALIALWCCIGATSHATRRLRHRRTIHRDIRDLEHHINNPAVQAIYRDQPRKEEDR